MIRGVGERRRYLNEQPGQVQWTRFSNRSASSGTDSWSNPIVQLASQLIVIYVVLLWLGTAYWAFRDMQARTENPILPYFAAALIIFFTPLLFVFAVVLYLIVRPRETLAEVYERSPRRGEPARRGREERALPRLPRSGRCRLARLPELPHPAPPRLPVVQPPRRAELAAVRLLRP